MFSQQRHSTTEPHCIRNAPIPNTRPAPILPQYCYTVFHNEAVMPQIAANDQVHASAKAASSQSATRLRPSTITKGTSFTKGISLLIKPPQGFVARDSMWLAGGPTSSRKPRIRRAIMRGAANVVKDMALPGRVKASRGLNLARFICSPCQPCKEKAS